MKKTTLLIFLAGIMASSSLCRAQEQPSTGIIDLSIIGGGPAGLKNAYLLVKNGKNPVVYSKTVGGPVLRGGTPETWQSPRVS